MMLTLGITYIVLVNAFGLFLMTWDKQKSARYAWRIPEKTLLGTAVLGGSIGIWAGMRIFRHKTRHAQFRYGVPLIVVLQLIGIWWLFTPH